VQTMKNVAVTMTVFTLLSFSPVSFAQLARPTVFIEPQNGF
jgi:hypothetical protein